MPLNSKGREGKGVNIGSLHPRPRPRPIHMTSIVGGRTIRHGHEMV